MTQYKNLGEHQLIQMAEKIGSTDLELNEEWMSRFGMSFPYRLNIRREIENRLLDQVVKDEEADKMILKQAERLRGR